MPLVGVLALQGDVREHVAMLHEVGADVVLVKKVEHLDGLDALVMPGGESTTIARLLTTSGIRAALAERLSAGLHVFGTCAGLILLSAEILDGRSDQWSFNSLPVAVRRNGYGRQIASFETTVHVSGVGSVPRRSKPGPTRLKYSPRTTTVTAIIRCWFDEPTYGAARITPN
jgi:5'-phosphate synthase pdxT subunit